MLRVGSEANRRGVRRFDGAFTVLRVQQVTDEGFAGTWESGVDMDRVRRPLLRQSSDRLTAGPAKTKRRRARPQWSRPPLLVMEAQGIEPWSE